MSFILTICSHFHLQLKPYTCVTGTSFAMEVPNVSSVVDESSKQVGNFEFPAGFPPDIKESLNKKVANTCKVLSNNRKRGFSVANALKKWNDAVLNRQNKVDEYLQQKTVKEVNEHTTKEANRVVETVENEGKKTRGDFQQLLSGDLPSAGYEMTDPREERRAIKIAKAMLNQRDETLKHQVKMDNEVQREMKAPKRRGASSSKDVDAAAAEVAVDVAVAEAGDEVVAEPVAKSARKLKYEHLMQDDGKYHCGDCTFTTASHQGIATHMSRSHKGA